MAGEISNPIGDLVQTLDAITANTTTSIPAGYAIQSVYVVNTTANAVTGGVKIGTTSGGVDVVAALTVGANFIGQIFDAALLLRLFSTSTATTLYIQPVVAWNSASLNLRIVLRKLY